MHDAPSISWEYDNNTRVIHIWLFRFELDFTFEMENCVCVPRTACYMLVFVDAT